MGCPEGVICIEQYTILFISLVVFCMLYTLKTSTQISQPSSVSPVPAPTPASETTVFPMAIPSSSYTNGVTDTLLNPYAPPQQHSEHHAYKQLGYLKNSSMSGKLFPIFGKPAQIKRDKWNYYTIYDNIKVPIFHNNRNCIDELGCDSLYNDDTVNIENLSETFNVSMYKNSGMTYMPQII